MSRWIVALQAACMMIISVGAAINFLSFDLNPIAGSSGWVIAISGLVCIVAGVRALNRNLTIWVEPRSQLVTGGIYRFTRNPIYVGGLLMSTGWALMFLSLVSAIGAVGLALVLNQKVKLEEAALEKKFGDDYRAYRRVTARWLWKF